MRTYDTNNNIDGWVCDCCGDEYDSERLRFYFARMHHVGKMHYCEECYIDKLGCFKAEV